MTEFDQKKQVVKTQINAENYEIHYHHHYKSNGQGGVHSENRLKASTSELATTQSDIEQQLSGARTRRQQQSFKAMCDAIDGQHEVIVVLVEELKSILSNDELSAADTELVVQTFNQLSDSQAVNCIQMYLRCFVVKEKNLR